MIEKSEFCNGCIDDHEHHPYLTCYCGCHR